MAKMDRHKRLSAWPKEVLGFWSRHGLLNGHYASRAVLFLDMAMMLRVGQGCGSGPLAIWNCCAMWAGFRSLLSPSACLLPLCSRLFFLCCVRWRSTSGTGSYRYSPGDLDLTFDFISVGSDMCQLRPYEMQLCVKKIRFCSAYMRSTNKRKRSLCTLVRFNIYIVLL